jgi:hypothetical protein
MSERLNEAVGHNISQEISFEDGHARVTKNNGVWMYSVERSS